MITTIRLFGDLAERFTAEFVADVNNVGEAIAALEVNFFGFREHLATAHEHGIAFNVRIGKDWELTEEQIFDPTCGHEIYITPAIIGAGKTLGLILGVALIGLGTGGIGFLGLSPLMMIVTGALLILSGLMGPKTEAPSDTDEEGKKSFIMNGAVNTTTVGGRVPIPYGSDIYVGSTVISAGVSVNTIFDQDDD